MEESVRVETSNGLADIEKVTDEADQRHIGIVVPTTMQQAAEVGGLKIRVSEKRPAVLGGAHVVKRNEIGVAETAADTGHLQKALIVC
jgi:hypothetical protein